MSPPFQTVCRFDGFRFDGVTSMLYHHHGIDKLGQTQRSVINFILKLWPELWGPQLD